MLTCSYMGGGQAQFTNKNKGFTLIELLAVIVILAIIAVIATPIITGIIEDAKKEAFVRSVEGLLKGAEEAQLIKELEGTPYTELVFDFSNPSTLTDLDVSGKLPTSGIMRINKDGEKSIVTNNGTYCARKNMTDKEIEVFKYDANTCKEVYKESILNGGYPILDSKMTAIYYDGTTPKIANVTSAWYSYQNRLWANAVILKDNPSKDYSVIDTVVNESDVVAYFVWIPRYSYTVKGSYGVNGTSTSAPGYIDIKFINKKEKETGTATYTSGSPSNYRTQDGFTFGEEELVGFWVGKFETTGNSTTPTIKPNVSSLRNQNVSTQFETAKKIGTNNGLTNETSMMKNDEWNAVAILSQSLYGRCESTGTCVEISINNSASFITGSSAGKYGDNTTTGSTVYAYNTAQGITASTTSNITGIYDMSGGAWEYVMGALADTTGKPYSGRHNVWNSGFIGKFGNPAAAPTDNSSIGDANILELTTGKALPSSKYYNVYSTSDRNTACNGKCYGLVETAGWYRDYANMPSSSSPWVLRGGHFFDGVNAGAWYFYSSTGIANGSHSFRVVVRGA